MPPPRCYELHSKTVKALQLVEFLETKMAGKDKELKEKSLPIVDQDCAVRARLS